MHENFLIAFLFTLFAGLSTGIGSLIAFFAKKDNKKFLALALGFSAGVMIYISFGEIFIKANMHLIMDHGVKWGSVIAVSSFFGGIFLMAFIDRLIPEKTAYKMKNIEDNSLVDEKKELKDNRLLRSGMLAAIVLTIHNFPEGLTSFLSTLDNPTLAIPIVVAIAIHNIPEGIAISVPIYQATGSKKKAFFYSLLSGMTEPIGALIGYFIFMPFISDTLFGVLFAMVAGIMIYISLNELFPTAREYGKRLSIYGLVAGMAIMAISLLLFI